jgi:hypothetical protein
VNPAILVACCTNMTQQQEDTQWSLAFFWR